MIDMQTSRDTRFELSWTHQSGHVTDDVPDSTLLGSNLGNEIITLRLIHDVDEHFRFGGSLAPIIGSEPKMRPFAADQFFEWFPWGQSATAQQASFYTAIGFQEMGVDHLMFTYQGQLGLLWGNHFRRLHKTSLRAVAGYYRGIDPRLKYAQFMLSRAEFGYVGFAVDF
jgi:hypothetical protein